MPSPPFSTETKLLHGSYLNTHSRSIALLMNTVSCPSLYHISLYMIHRMATMLWLPTVSVKHSSFLLASVPPGGQALRSTFYGISACCLKRLETLPLRWKRCGLPIRRCTVTGGSLFCANWSHVRNKSSWNPHSPPSNTVSKSSEYCKSTGLFDRYFL